MNVQYILLLTQARDWIMRSEVSWVDWYKFKEIEFKAETEFDLFITDKFDKASRCKETTAL